MSSTSLEASVPAKKRRGALRAPVWISGDWGGRIGLVLLGIVVLAALVGPLVAPHSPTAAVGIPGQASSGQLPLGVDSLGRDVLSRLLYGGRTVLLLGGAATVCTYIIGISVGLVAGYARSIVDPLLMRTVDVVLAFPALLLMLLVITGVGSGRLVLVFACTLVLFPGVARIVRVAALDVSKKGYVEAAVARGESTASVLRREILPNITAPIVADLGVRFGWSIILIASVNFLGLGLQPPTADWGLMISENESIISTNALAVIAPAAALAFLTIAVNLLGDAYVRNQGRSRLKDRPA